MALKPKRRKREVTADELKKHVESHPRAPLSFDGMRYTHPVKMKGLIWNKPVGSFENGKHFIIEDL